MKLSITYLLIIALTSYIFLPACKKDHADPFIVDAGTYQTIQLPTNSVTLVGTIKSGGTSSMSYAWLLISGPNVPNIVSSTSATTQVNNLVEGKYIFQFQATNNNGTTAVDTTSVTVLSKVLIIRTITIQPGIITGQDAKVLNIAGGGEANVNYGNNGFIELTAWTYGGNSGTIRSFLKFSALDTLPADAVITDAKLTLYPVSDLLWPGYLGNSTYPSSPYNSYGDNKAWLQRCTQSWDESTITYNNQPAITTANQVEIPASTSRYDYIVSGVDVTQLVKDMKTTPGTNFGFGLRLQAEAIYRDMRFDASESKADSSTGPKLVVTYQY